MHGLKTIALRIDKTEDDLVHEAANLKKEGILNSDQNVFGKKSQASESVKLNFAISRLFEH